MLAEPKLAIILQPHLRGSSSSSSQPKAKPPASVDGPASGGDKSRAAKRRARVAREKAAADAAAAELARVKAETARLKAAARSSGGGGGGKAGKAAGRNTPNMPRELVGKSAVSAKGVRMCYGFNMACGCTKAQPGQSCDRGFHGCMEPLPDGAACGKPHPCANH